MLNVGIIGAGKISLRHVEALKSIEGVNLISVADIISKRSESLSKLFGGTSYKDYKVMITKESIDCVIINLPHNLHKDCAIWCAGQGINIFLEKPMAIDSNECKKIILETEKFGVKLVIGHVQRYFPENILAKEIIDSGELGEVTTIMDCRNINYFSSDRPAWFLDKSRSGGGILMNFGAHSLDKLKWLTGSKIKNIYGKVGNGEMGHNIEGHAQALVEMECGVTATLNYSGYKEVTKNETIIHLTKGTLKLVTGKGLWKSINGEYISLPVKKVFDPFKKQLEEFVDQITGSKTIVTDGLYGKEIISAIESIYNNNK
ncbi:MAG: Gfo/Idh/MocA family oxidoreductase [Spirochaetaceae bacterium]